MRNLLIVAAIVTLVSACALSGCAGTTQKIDTALANPKNQEDVKWACLGLEGSMRLALAAGSRYNIDATVLAVVANVNQVLVTSCKAAREGRLQNSNDVFAVIMDLTGQLQVALEPKS